MQQEHGVLDTLFITCCLFIQCTKEREYAVFTRVLPGVMFPSERLCFVFAGSHTESQAPGVIDACTCQVKEITLQVQPHVCAIIFTSYIY